MSPLFAAEPKLTLSSLIKQHPTLSGVCRRTLFRWASRGVGGAKLESIRLGGRVFSSMGALDRYLAAINGTDSPITPPRSPDQRRRDSEAAARELVNAGA